jgi:FkbM family methyltransferase
MQEVAFTYEDLRLEIQSDVNDYISGCIDSTNTFYEIKMLEAIFANFPENTVLDVGANIGNHALYFAKFTSATTIHAFEPMPKSFQHLSANMTRNGCNNVILHNVALSDLSGEATMDFPDPTNQGMAKITEGGVKVQTTRLDDLNIEDVSLIKIDVEGHELSVLRGGTETIRKNRPHLYIEIQDEYQLSKVEDFLREFGYFRGRVYNSTPTYAFHPGPEINEVWSNYALKALEAQRIIFDSNIEALNKHWRQRHRQLELAYAQLASDKNKLQLRLDLVLGSISWRITSPIRHLLKFVKGHFR